MTYPLATWAYVWDNSQFSEEIVKQSHIHIAPLGDFLIIIIIIIIIVIIIIILMMMMVI